MRQVTFFAMLGVSLVLSQTRAQGAPKGPLVKARLLCKKGSFGKGLEAAVHAGLRGSKAWRPVARFCLRSWIRRTARRCAPNRKVESDLQMLDQISAKAAKIAMPAVARAARRAKAACLAKLPKSLRAACSAQPGPKTLRTAKFLARLASKTLAPKFQGAVASCAKAWIENVAMRCKVRPSLPLLKEAAQVTEQAPGSVKPDAKAAYAACAKAMASYGLALCRSGKFLQGRKLAREGLDRFAFFGARDDTFEVETSDAIRKQCGRILFRLTGRMTARVGKVQVQMALQGVMVLTGPKRKLRGVLIVHPKVTRAQSQAGDVLVRPQTCRVEMRGRLNPKTGNVAWWPAGKSLSCTEAIQITGPRGTARLIRETLVADLLKASVLKSWMPATTGSATSLNFRGPLGGGRTADFSGRLELRRLDEPH